MPKRRIPLPPCRGIHQGQTRQGGDMTTEQWKKILERHRISLTVLLILLHDEYIDNDSFTTLYFSGAKEDINIDDAIAVDTLSILDGDFLELIKFIYLLTEDKHVDIGMCATFDINPNEKIKNLYNSLYVSESITDTLNRKKIIATEDVYNDLKQRASDKFGESYVSFNDLYHVHVSPKRLLNIINQHDECKKFISRNLQFALQENGDPVKAWEDCLAKEQDLKTKKYLSAYFKRNAQGMTWKEVAAEFGVDKRSPPRWMEEAERFKQKKGLPPLPALKDLQMS